MSEHQIYEFLSLDHPLSRQAQGELRQISTRAQITSTRFFNEYEWGDLKGNPREMLATYFDAFLYLANWGSRWLMFKLPLSLIDAELIDDYCDGELVSLKKAGKKHAILSFQSSQEDDEYFENYWEHIESLSELIHIREQIIQGDYRALFMFYIHQCQHLPDALDQECWPTIPADLDRHDSALERFTSLFGLDDDLISAAASLSPRHKKSATPSLTRASHEAFIATLTEEEKNSLLLEVMSASPREVKHTLLSKFRQHTPQTNAPNQQRLTPQTLAQLLDTSKSIKQERLRKQKQELARKEEERARKEREELERHKRRLIQNWDETWHIIEDAILTFQRKGYQKAATLLYLLLQADLTAEQMQHTLTQIANLRSTYSRRSALLEEFDNKNLP